MRADLKFWVERTTASAEERAQVRKALGVWQTHTGLAAVRGAAALEGLPLEERPGWNELWADVIQAVRDADR